MNKLERFFGTGREAKLRYRAGDFEILAKGDFVKCAVTGQQIELENLRYWNVEQQEPYSSAEAALKRQLDLMGRGPPPA
jgi:hypothetical protein